MRLIRALGRAFLKDLCSGAHLAVSAAVMERASTAVSSSVSTHCPYCALQCGMHLARDQPQASRIEVIGNAKFPVNEGGLCVKGWSAAATLDHPDRLRAPLVRNASGRLEPATWEMALQRVASSFGDVQRRYGADAVAVFGGGSLTNEKAYLLGKFARVALGTANIDYNGRFCMSSAAAAQSMAFGIDRGLPFPIADIAEARAILLVGSNVAETMPPIMRYFERQQERGGKLIVADPRRTPTAQWATCHLPLRPGSDTALANGLLHVLVRDNLIDQDYIRSRTDDFDEVRRVVAAYWPERVEKLTGVPERLLIDSARLLGTAGRAMVLTARGPEQQAQGVNNTLAYINLALALGGVGKPSAASALSPDKATDRVDASTGRRPISCPATGASTIPPPASMSRPCGECRHRRFPAPADRRAEQLDIDRQGRRRAGDVRHGIEHRGVGAGRHTRRRAPTRARLVSSSPTSSSRKRRASPTSCCPPRSGRKRTAR